MYKLKDVIASRGRNPKINKALDRYELSKKEKKDIVDEVKNISGSGGGTASSVEYLDVSSPSPVREAVIGFANLIKTEDTNINYPESSSSILHIATGIAPIGNLFQSITGLGYEGFTAVLNAIKAVSIDFSTPIIMGENNPIITIKQVFSGAEEMLDAIPRITKEEFYDLNNI